MTPLPDFRVAGTAPGSIIIPQGRFSKLYSAGDPLVTVKRPPKWMSRPMVAVDNLNPDTKKP